MTDVIRNSDMAGVPALGCTQDFFYRAGGVVELPVISRGDGIYLWDVEGNRYIDASSGPVVSTIGHCEPRIAAAMGRQAETLDYSYARLSRTRENLRVTERIAHLAGPGFERVFMASGGSEAVDMAIKFARQYKVARGENERTRIISLMPSYHGMTLATLAASGDLSYEPVFRDMAVFSIKIPAPMAFRSPGQTTEQVEQGTLDALDAAIREAGTETVLAFIVEPVGGLATGCLAPSEFFFAGVREICSRHGVVLIHDEIMSGGGRTGHFLSSHNWTDARPDLVCLGKGLGAGYTPLGVMLASAQWVDELRSTLGFNLAHTANANPISCVVVDAVLNVIEDNGLIANARKQGRYLRDAILAMRPRHPVIGDVRGQGLLLALEICDSQRQRFATDPVIPDRIRQLALHHGMLLYARLTNEGRYGDWIMITPPLVITREQCDDYLQRLDAILTALETELRQQDLLS